MSNVICHSNSRKAVSVAAVDVSRYIKNFECLSIYSIPANFISKHNSPAKYLTKPTNFTHRSAEGLDLLNLLRLDRRLLDHLVQVGVETGGVPRGGVKLPPVTVTVPPIAVGSAGRLVVADGGVSVVVLLVGQRLVVHLLG